MGLARNFITQTGNANEITLNWIAPIGFNDTSNELIVTKTISHYPVELFNSSFPNKATDSRPIEIYRGSSIVGSNTGSISVSGNTLTDSAASFPTNPSLKGRLIRDSESKVFRIISNTATEITIKPIQNVNISSGKYVILPDFPTNIRNQENFEPDSRTLAEPGRISNLVIFEAGGFAVRQFEPDELTNLIFFDGNGDRFFIKSNDELSINFYENATPAINAGIKILNSHKNTQPLPYIDTFLNEAEAQNRTGTGLQNDQAYYYTIFTLDKNANVAQAEFTNTTNETPTQDFALSPEDKGFGDKLYNLWPSIYREVDEDEDLKDLMRVFGFTFSEIHALINTYKLQDPDNVLVNALLPLSEQTGLPSVGFSIGVDTLRRIAKDMIPCWKLKGTKEGIAVFIRKITTWDITSGTADFSSAIQDTLPNVSALRFFDNDLGTANTRLTESFPSITPGGRFAKGLPGVVIPGFFTFREFVINLNDVALFTGAVDIFTSGQNTTTITDSTANFGSNNSLVGNFLLPNQEEVNDIFQIVENTSTSITIRGIINNQNPGSEYAVLSPLNTNRFFILNRLLPFYIPFGTSAGFIFN